MIQGNGVVFTGLGQVTFGPVNIPDPDPDDVVVSTRFSWISNGTEISYLRGERLDGDTPWRSGNPAPFPIVPGYQKTGIVERVGKKVSGIKPGDWVFVPSSKVCDGFFHDHGGHVSLAVQSASKVWKLPKGLPPLAASALVLTQVGYNCGTSAPVQEGDVALVIGDGLVGHWSAQTLIHRGATVILAGRHEERLAHFSTGPGRHCVNVTKTELTEAVKEIAPEGIQVVVDTVGSVQALEACYPIVRKHAHLVSAGFCGTNGLIDIQRLRALELSLHTPAGWEKARMDATLALLAAGHLDTVSLITHRFPAKNAPEAYQLILKRTEPVLGVILEWGEES